LRFIGLPEGYLPISDQIQSKKKKRQAQEDYSMQWDDSDDDDIKLPEVPINDQAGGQNLAPITHNRVLTNEDKLHMFLENPVEAISVFMTSHLWNKGYIWYVLCIVTGSTDKFWIVFQVGRQSLPLASTSRFPYQISLEEQGISGPRMRISSCSGDHQGRAGPTSQQRGFYESNS
jgi:hypothetical protein